ncbi:anti-sigma regulatory factor (Ser/Thr protein kinase) [Pseudorhizobium tarimense]|uniref:Anti-sigma regulatory factor (Ser/Thr protein kinase) n=1 Tax=Pseudorhizobium tarimense TaxID=1079109 RepID=A0ABV2HCR1_9HYPH|nr:ATP-binding protein [Pseudorhizobium tarimense]MCJ8521179.1 ATP-binding protein [Pseudorhizobium tarimense]
MTTNTRDSIRFLQLLRRGTSIAVKKKKPLVRRSPGRSPQLIGYNDFSYPTSISTAAAVVLAAEYERMRTMLDEVPPTVVLDRWNDEVFRKLYQLGFFEIVGITPKRTDVVIDEGDVRTMQIVSSQNADDLERIDAALQKLGEFMNPTSSIPESVIIDLLTGLSEALSNVTGHAYPDDYQPIYPHIGRFWVSATADRRNHSLTVVVYDQGVTIPVTYPRIERLEKVYNYLGRTLRQQPSFDFENDGTYIRAAMKYGGSRTDQKHRGKGLPQIIDVIKRIGRGRLTVFSRGGWCTRAPNGRFSSGAVPYSLGGTLAIVAAI